jgi:hypothetical protein
MAHHQKAKTIISLCLIYYYYVHAPPFVGLDVGYIIYTFTYIIVQIQYGD